LFKPTLVISPYYDILILNMYTNIIYAHSICEQTFVNEGVTNDLHSMWWHTLLDGGELEVRLILSQLGVTGCLLELSICLGRVILGASQGQTTTTQTW